jgi:EAL domain-containing protein (putative c-di-GMP-specific phosphodiesterase class I)
MTYTGAISSEQIQEAIESGEMELHYQPQSNLVSGGISGVEALVRWNSKTLGSVSTVHFINILESSEIGLIAKFHEWLIRTAFRQIVAWRKIGISVPIDLNFSTRYLQERECLTIVEQLLQEYDLPPSCFGIEVTESFSISHLKEIQFVLESLNKIGIGIALDDFCTSYCSLEYLSELPVTKIKIDKKFIHQLDNKSLQRQNAINIILESVVEMAFNLGITVVAEGVETFKQLEAVTLIGCDSYQGYLFCPPIPADLATETIFKELNWQANSFSQHNFFPDVSLEAIAA